MYSDPDRLEPVIDRLKALGERMADAPGNRIVNEAVDALLGLQREMNAQRDLADAILAVQGRWTIVYDADGRVVRAGAAINEMAGMSLIGMGMQDIIRRLSICHPDGRPLQQDELPASRALRGERVTGERLTITDREGRTAHVRVSAVPVPSGAVSVWQDVTEQEQLQRSLNEAETLIEGIFESLGDIVGVQLPDHTIVRYNRAGYEMLGLTPEEANGKKCYRLIGRNSPCEICATRAAIQSRRQERLEKYAPEMGRYLECWSTPILDKNGDVLLIVEHLHDITDRTLVMEALRESEATARALLNAPTDAISLIGADGRLIDVNETMLKWYGEEREAVVGRHINEFLPPEVALRRLEHLAGVFGTGTPARFEEEGVTAWYDAVIYPIRDEAGRVVRAAVIAREITDRKQMEERLAANEELFRSIFKEAGIGIVLIDLDWRILRANPAFCRMLNYEEKDLIGRWVVDITHPDDLEVNRTLFYEVATGRRNRFQLEKRYVTQGGGIVWGRLTVTLLRDANGLPRSVISMVEDINRYKMAETLKEAAFSRIEQNMEQFAILGDHVRHPLQVILARADLLADEEAAEKIREQVRRINGYVKALDQGWIESRKIREFLQRNEMT